MPDAAFNLKRGKQHMQHISTTLRGLSVAASALGVASVVACSGDSTGLAANGNGQIGFMAASSAGANLDVVPETIAGHSLNITGVNVTISRAELKQAHEDNCPGDDDDDDDHPHAFGSTQSCGELKVGPATIALPLTGDVVTVPANAIPAGTYREIEVRLARVELMGTFDGKAFDDTVPVRAKGEIEFDTPLVVTADTPVSITVSLPVNDWLKNQDGSLIDPTTLSTDPSALLRVKLNISRSVRAFEDHDHDGHEDHDDGHGGHGRG